MIKKLIVSLVVIGAGVAFAQRTAFNIGGRTIASQYALWEVHSTNPVPVGTATMILDRCTVIAGPEEGKNILPWATNAPVLVLDGNSETVTPIAVGIPKQGLSGPTQCQITATFTKAHPAGVSLLSGSFGLAEAVNDLAGTGGLVVLDSSWRGSTGQITSLGGGYANVGIEDIRSGLTIYTWNGSAYAGAPPVTSVSGTASHISSSGGATPQIDLANPLSVPNLAANILFNSDNNNDIGGSGAMRPRNLFLGTSLSLNNNSFATQPSASTSGEVRMATVTNRPADSANGVNGGIYYPLSEAMALRIHRALAYNGNNSANSMGSYLENLNVTTNSPAQITSTSTTPDLLSYQTTTTSGNVAFVSSSGNLNRVGKNVWWSGQGAVSTTSSYRWWFGLYGSSQANEGSANNFASAKAAFLATSDSTGGASTTNYNCVTDDGTTANIVPSNVAATSNLVHKFDIREDAANARFYFYIDGNPVCSSPISTNAPAGGTTLKHGQVLTTLTTAAATAYFAYSETWNDN